MLNHLYTDQCTMMVCRNDAGLAAAELALAVEKHVLESESIDTVGTVGKFCLIDLQELALNGFYSPD